MKPLSLLASSVAAIALSAASGASFAADAAAASPSVVLVHGAFADGSDWNQVIELLQAKGVHVTAVQNPLSSLEDDVAATQRAIAREPGKVVLVGHPWGGTVITQAGASDKVSALVYVAAFAPDVGQNTAQLGKAYPPPQGFAYLSSDAQGYLVLSEEGVRQHFAQDLPAGRTTVMAATQGPIRASAFEQRVSEAAWKQHPSWFVLTEEDHMIPPAQQRDMARHIGARVTALPTSHVPQEVQPARVAEVILDAVKHSR
jgi:pimeloyl-ACP methyl ester carboxylesterase